MEPRMVTSGLSGTITTFDGAGVRIGPPPPFPVPFPPPFPEALEPPTNGSDPFITLSVTKAMIRRPTSASVGASHGRTAPRAPPLDVVRAGWLMPGPNQSRGLCRRH